MSVQYLSHKGITLIEKSAFKALDCFTAIDWFMSHLSLTTADCPFCIVLQVCVCVCVVGREVGGLVTHPSTIRLIFD